jgi:hypothetical protein
MSSNKLTPEQAWVHVKALCKDADHMENHEGYTTIRNHDGTIPDVVIEEGVIDWPEGMDRYPPEVPTESRQKCRDLAAQPMETAPKDRDIELLMDGKWLEGDFDNGFWWSKTKHGMCTAWDRGHQPTAWREPRQKT